MAMVSWEAEGVLDEWAPCLTGVGTLAWPLHWHPNLSWVGVVGMPDHWPASPGQRSPPALSTRPCGHCIVSLLPLALGQTAPSHGLARTVQVEGLSTQALLPHPCMIGTLYILAF